MEETMKFINRNGLLAASLLSLAISPNILGMEKAESRPLHAPQQATLDGIPNDIKKLIILEIALSPNTLTGAYALNNLKQTNKSYHDLVIKFHESTESSLKKDLNESFRIFSAARSENPKALKWLKTQPSNALNRCISEYPKYLHQTLRDLKSSNASNKTIINLLEEATVVLNQLIKAGSKINKSEASHIAKLANRIDDYVYEKFGTSVKFWDLLEEAGADRGCFFDYEEIKNKPYDI